MTQNLLPQLHIYTYLTISQFLTIGYDKSTKTLRKELKLLREKGMIDKHTYKYSPKLGKLEDVYCLKPKGRKYLEESDGIISTKRTKEFRHKPFYEDYVHRKMTINTHIALRQHLEQRGAEIETFDTYFERKKSPTNGRYETATKLSLGSGYIIPDAIMVVHSGQKKFLYCIEVHRGCRVQKIQKQLTGYGYALANGAASLKYGIARNANIIVIFEKEQTMHTVTEAFQENLFYTHIRDYYHFISYNSLSSDIRK